MPAARYWRITGMVPYGYGDLELSEFALYEAGVRVDTGPTAPIAPTTGTLAALSDSSNGSTCAWSALRYSLPGFALVYDLGSAKLVDEVRIGAGASQTGFPATFSLDYSTDGATWSGQTKVDGVNWPGSANTQTIKGSFDLLPFAVLSVEAEGANGSTQIIDSVGRKTLTAAGGAVLSTTTPITGSSSLHLPSNGATVTIPANSDFDFGTGDFVIRVRVRGTQTADGWILGTYARNPQNASSLSNLLYIESGTVNFTWYVGGTPSVISICAASTIADGNPHTIEISRSAGVIRTFYDGVAGGSTTNGSANNAGYPFIIGGINGTFERNWVGRIDSLLIAKGIAGNTAAYTPPTGPEFDGFTGQRAATTSFGAVLGPMPAPYAPSPVGVVYRDPAIRNHRRDFEGHGRIVGTTKEKALPANTPLRRQVFCMDMLTGTIVADLWSDATTGAYVFNDLDLTRRYTVFSYDHTNAYRAVIADNLQPELMP